MVLVLPAEEGASSYGAPRRWQKSPGSQKWEDGRVEMLTGCWRMNDLNNTENFRVGGLCFHFHSLYSPDHGVRLDTRQKQAGTQGAATGMSWGEAGATCEHRAHGQGEE